MLINLNDITIILDSSVKHISKTASMALSGILENGMVLSNNPVVKITIYKDRIDFGQCLNSELSSVSGLIFYNFYKEYGNIVYRYASNLRCSILSKTIEYVGVFPPTKPDNQQIYELLYPKFM